MNESQIFEQHFESVTETQSLLFAEAQEVRLKSAAMVGEEAAGIKAGALRLVT